MVLGVNRWNARAFRRITSTWFSGVLLAAAADPAAADTDVAFRLARGAGGDLREVRVRSRESGVQWLAVVRSRGTARDEARFGVSGPWGGGTLRAGTLREAVPAPGRLPADPLDPPRIGSGPALTTARGTHGVAWSREGIRGGLSVAFSEDRGGRAVPAVRTRWRGLEAAAAGGSRRVGALAGALADGPVRARAECWTEGTRREARVAFVAAGAGLAAAVRGDRSLPWNAEILGGVSVPRGAWRGLALRVRAGHRSAAGRESWRVTWHRLGAGVAGEIAESRGRVRWSARASRALPEGWIVECGLGGGAPRPSETSMEMRRVRGGLRGGVRLALAEERARRGSAWLARDVGRAAQLRAGGAWERGRSAALNVEWSWLLRGSP